LIEQGLTSAPTQ